MDEHAVLGNDADLHAAALEQVVEPPVSVAVQERLDLWNGLVPALLEQRLADVLRDHHVRGVQLAVAEDLHDRDVGDLLAHELEDGAAEVAGDATVGPGSAQAVGEERVVEPLAPGAEPADEVRRRLVRHPSRWLRISSRSTRAARASSGRSCSSCPAR